MLIRQIYNKLLVKVNKAVKQAKAKTVVGDCNDPGDEKHESKRTEELD